MRCPRAGLVTPHAGGSETRPAGLVAGLPGAGCPGSGSVVRYHEARDRTELKALKASGKSRGRAPRGERVLQKGARAARTRKARRSSACRAGTAESTPRLSALRLPFVCSGGSVSLFDKARAQKTRRENGIAYPPLPACGERSSEARVRGPVRDSERRESSGGVADGHATLSPAETPPHPDLLPARGEKEKNAPRERDWIA